MKVEIVQKETEYRIALSEEEAYELRDIIGDAESSDFGTQLYTALDNALGE